MRVALALALGLLLAGCGSEPEVAVGDPVATSTPEVDPALLRELLGESLQVEGNQIRADGMLIRLAFDPLIRQTGPVSVQLVQGQGYRLTGVGEGSPLWLLGLRDGDVLTGVDKQAIIGREHELRSSYESRPSRVELTYMRGTEAHTVSLRIASGSAWRSSGSAELLVEPPTSSIRPSLPPRTTNVDPELATKIRCIAGESEALIGRCEIEREALDGLLGQPESPARQARVVPAVRDGQNLGFKLYGIRRGSIPSWFGFENGDLIISINGRSLATLEAAMAAYQSLRDQTELRVALERRGQPRQLEIVIVDELSGAPASLGGGSGTTPSPDLKDPFAGR